MASMTDEEIQEHDRAFESAAAVVREEILLHERAAMPTPRGWQSLQLNRALRSLDRVLQLNPQNWSAMWMAGKVHQRCGEFDRAFDWFKRAAAVAPSQADVAREASICAMGMGRPEVGIEFARAATELEPGNAGLLANLSLAYLLAGRLREAESAIELSLDKDPDDRISKSVAVLVQHFMTTGRTPPRSTPELNQYWRMGRSSH